MGWDQEGERVELNKMDSFLLMYAISMFFSWLICPVCFDLVWCAGIMTFSLRPILSICLFGPNFVSI